MKTFREVMSNVDVQPGGCWMWKRPPTAQGYGQLRYEGRRWLAHTVVYETLVRPVPKGMQLDHQCHNRDQACRGGRTCPHRLCVNPAHLEPATNLVNTRRGRAGAHEAEKTECPAGHPYDEENTYWSKATGRMCRICQRGHKRAYAD